MDRILLAIIASAVLVLLGAAGLYVTKTADLMHNARTVGVAGRNQWAREPLAVVMGTISFISRRFGGGAIDAPATARSGLGSH